MLEETEVQPKVLRMGSPQLHPTDATAETGGVPYLLVQTLIPCLNLSNFSPIQAYTAGDLIPCNSSIMNSVSM